MSMLHLSKCPSSTPEMLTSTSERTLRTLTNWSQQLVVNNKKPVWSKLLILKSKRLRMSRVAHQVRAYPSFHSMKQLARIISIPPWMGCKSIVGLHPALNSLVPICTPTWRVGHYESKMSCPSEEHNAAPWPGHAHTNLSASHKAY